MLSYDAVDSVGQKSNNLLCMTPGIPNLVHTYERNQNPEVKATVTTVNLTMTSFHR